MTANKILIDSSFLYALSDPTDQYRQAARAFAVREKSFRVIPDVALTEVTHILNRRIGHRAMITFLKTLTASDAQLEPVTMDDVKRAHSIMAQYSDSHFDFVDCCIMALSERLNITRVCTFDRRDFSIFRPAHCDYLELLP